ncbi:MAG: hypothetical protein ACRD2C_14960 [Acidimicrobiales bacterium]
MLVVLVLVVVEAVVVVDPVFVVAGAVVVLAEGAVVGAVDAGSDGAGFSPAVVDGAESTVVDDGVFGSSSSSP